MPGQTFDLRITFTGLCMFVPEPEQPGYRKRLHVLMPTTAGHADNGIEEHACRLRWHSKYEPGSGADQWGGDVALNGSELRLDGLQRDVYLTLPSELVPLGDICDVGEVDLDKILAEGKLTAWVNLGSGEMADPQHRICWQVPKGTAPRPMTHQVEWMIPDYRTGVLEGWGLRPLDGSVGDELPTLSPVGGEIHLHIYHVPPDELPATPSAKPEEKKHPPEARHFLRYYVLLASEPTRKPIPWRHSTQPPTKDVPCADLEEDPVPSEYISIESENCMGAQARLVSGARPAVQMGRGGRGPVG